uniref:Conotoxin Cl11.2 n=1 Tax=Californiconus californicus TaxID=1736779 RepID=I1B2_CONCL
MKMSVTFLLILMILPLFTGEWQSGSRLSALKKRLLEKRLLQKRFCTEIGKDCGTSWECCEDCCIHGTCSHESNCANFKLR